jgi:ABC-type phosphate transport system substrate-binding protein
MLMAENLTTSENDNILVAVVASDPLAVGFFGRAFYAANQSTLRAVRIRGTQGAADPDEASVLAGIYPLARPLFLYSSAATLRARPEVEAFVGCYLNRLLTEIAGVGYLPPGTAMYQTALDSFNVTCRNCRRVAGSDARFPEIPACSVEGLGANPIAITGSSTVEPLTQRMATLFTEAGYGGTVQIQTTGTGAGFERFCVNGDQDIINASRPIRENERQRCLAIQREPVVFPIGIDALTVAVSRQNSFVDELSVDQLHLLFTEARLWSDVNPIWPAEPVIRAIPGEQSGTFDFFVEKLHEGGGGLAPAVQAVPVEVANNVVNEPTATPTTAATDTATPAPTATVITPTATTALVTATPLPTVLPTATNTIAPPTAPPATATTTPSPVPTLAADYVFGVLAGRPACQFVTDIVTTLMNERFDLRTITRTFTSTDDLYRALAQVDAPEQWVDFTLCHVFPDDSDYLSEFGSQLKLMGSGYGRTEGKRWYLIGFSGHFVDLRTNRPCLNTFLTDRLDFDPLVFSEDSAAAWVTNQPQLVDEWTRCE